MRTVLIQTPLHTVGLQILSRKFEIVHCTDRSAAVGVARESNATAAIIGGLWQITADVLEQIPTLLAIGRPGIGVDNIDLEAATMAGVAVVNTPDAPTIATVEHTLSLILALAKRHKAAARQLAHRIAPQTESLLIELRGKVLGLIGLGRIGSGVARVCDAGFGMKVIGFDPNVTEETPRALNISLCPTVYDVLSRSDVVSLHVPVTSQTVRLIDARALAIMKPSAVLINCARGSVVDEKALIDALRSGRLAGAGLDVFDPEPPDPANPLLAMENVIATPHSGAATEDTMRRMGQQVADQIIAVLDNTRPSNLVNPDVWNHPARHQRQRAAEALTAA